MISTGFGQGLILSQNRVLGNTFIKIHFKIIMKISFCICFLFIQNYTIKLFCVRLTFMVNRLAYLDNMDLAIQILYCFCMDGEREIYI
jgi:hypothetical protein